MGKNYILSTSVFLSVLFLFPFSALAIPILGVAPSVSEYGAYNGPSEDYLSYFADEYASLWKDAGFILPDSGGSLSVWYGGDTSKEVVLATNSAAGYSFAFDGSEWVDFTDMYAENQGQIAGYKEQIVDNDGSQFSFYGVSLGSVDNNPKWEELNSDPWGSRSFYIYTGTFTYSDFQPDQGDWIFAISDQNGDDFFRGREFSPKTTSSFSASNPVPEPATMLLLGTGLLALACAGRKIKK